MRPELLAKREYKCVIHVAVNVGHLETHYLLGSAPRGKKMSLKMQAVPRIHGAYDLSPLQQRLRHRYACVGRNARRAHLEVLAVPVECFSG